MIHSAFFAQIFLAKYRLPCCHPFWDIRSIVNPFMLSFFQFHLAWKFLIGNLPCLFSSHFNDYLYVVLFLFFYFSVFVFAFSSFSHSAYLLGLFLLFQMLLQNLLISSAPDFSLILMFSLLVVKLFCYLLRTACWSYTFQFFDEVFFQVFENHSKFFLLVFNTFFSVFYPLFLFYYFIFLFLLNFPVSFVTRCWCIPKFL